MPFSESGTSKTDREIIRERLKTLCLNSVSSLCPQESTGIWSLADVRSLIAVFEVERVSVLVERREASIHSSVVAQIIEKLSTVDLFPDPRSNTFIEEMEQYLRLLALVLRTYSYHHSTLTSRLHDTIYRGINKLSEKVQIHRSRREESQKIEDGNVAFLLTHCQSLLVSIDSSDSFPRKASRKALLVIDGVLAGVGDQYHELRKYAKEIARRQRSRPSWHPHFVRMEDACYAVFAREIPAQLSDIDLKMLLEDEAEATELLFDSLNELYENTTIGRSRFRESVGKVVGFITQVAQDSGPYEEDADYLKYGILDLMYQLSFRIHERSRASSFWSFLSGVRLVLENSPWPARRLQRKATDLWNQINQVGKNDHVTYGKSDDRTKIVLWINQNQNRNSAEDMIFSERFLHPKSLD